MKEEWSGSGRPVEMSEKLSNYFLINVPEGLIRNLLREKTWGYPEEKLVSAGNG
jgi:hypothetical protein